MRSRSSGIWTPRFWFSVWPPRSLRVTTASAQSTPRSSGNVSGHFGVLVEVLPDHMQFRLHARGAEQDVQARFLRNFVSIIVRKACAFSFQQRKSSGVHVRQVNIKGRSAPPLADRSLDTYMSARSVHETRISRTSLTSILSTRHACTDSGCPCVPTANFTGQNKNSSVTAHVVESHEFPSRPVR